MCSDYNTSSLTNAYKITQQKIIRRKVIKSYEVIHVMHLPYINERAKQEPYESVLIVQWVAC